MKGTDRGRVLIVEDEAYVRESLATLLDRRGYGVTAVESVGDAMGHLGSEPVDVVLSDLRMPGGDGLELVQKLRGSGSEVPVVILTGHGSVDSAVACLKAGASDYVVKPVDPDTLDATLERALEHRSLEREVRYLRQAAGAAAEEPLGESPAWKRVLAQVEAVAPTDSTVLLLGESGTGKELLARRLHARSRRQAAPFVRVNCAAVPVEMWESEFFGHRRGAFTGAAEDRDGYFRLADRGSLLLDEVGASSAAGQAKFLRVIQDGEFRRLGDRQPTRVDVRVIAATNSDLDAEVHAGRFRSDLFYRLNVVRIEVPPLRERPEDVALLARRFAEEVSALLGRTAPELGAEALARLRAYSWPGNVRELRNVVERALILDPVGGLRSLDLLPGPAGPPLPSSEVAGEGELNLREGVLRLERDLLLEAQRRSSGVKKQTAALLGVDPRNLSYYLRKHGLDGDPDQGR